MMAGILATIPLSAQEAVNTRLAEVDSQAELHTENPATDPFYQKEQITVTWIMIWNGSAERWWRESDYHGSKVLVDGEWVSTNWNDDRQIDLFCEAIRDAGIDVIAVDFTNGFRWERQAKRVQRFCHENNMKFVIAFNPQGGREMESSCRTVWDTYAAPTAEDHEAYLHRDGKPLVVLYTTRPGYQASIAIRESYSRRFSTAWASGEDSERDKWGWQLEPDIGPVGSEEAMFVTGAIKRYGPEREWDEGRRHLSWLDYGFVMARAHSPRFLIVGSFDDLRERNAWFVADTSATRPPMQTRDLQGTCHMTSLCHPKAPHALSSFEMGPRWLASPGRHFARSGTPRDHRRIRRRFARDGDGRLQGSTA